MEQPSLITNISLKHRGSGNTEWILKSAIVNPNIIILSKNQRVSDENLKRYKSLLKKEKWYKKIKWYIFSRKTPLFYSMNTSGIENVDRPIVFDLSCFV